MILAGIELAMIVQKSIATSDILRAKSVKRTKLPIQKTHWPLKNRNRP